MKKAFLFLSYSFFIIEILGYSYIHKQSSKKYFRSYISPFSTQLNFNRLDYDPIAIEKYYNKRPLEVWQRLIDVGSPILGWWLVKKYENITSAFRSPQENQILLNKRAEDLKNSIVQGIKLFFLT